MEPRIQYAKTSDGVDIAFGTAGDGPPLLVVPGPPLTHVQATWDTYAHLYQSLAERFQLVWYDSRGSGLSDREAIDFSMEAMMRDLQAIAEAGRLERFGMLALGDAVPIAVTYAATSPEKVSSLVLADGWMKPSDWKQNSAHVADEALRSGDWTLYTETFARLLLGFINQQLNTKGIPRTSVVSTIAQEVIPAFA